AAEPSLRERFRKFRRRHPRLYTAAWVALSALVLIVLPVGVAANERAKGKRLQQQVFRAQSKSLASRTASEAREAQIYLQSRHQSSEFQKQGADLVEGIASRYEIGDDANWVHRPELQQLPADERCQLLETMGYAFLVMSETAQSASRGDASPPVKTPQFWRQL